MMTGPHLRKPWTEIEQLIASGVRRGLSYREIGAEIATARGRATPLSERTIRDKVVRMSEKIEWGVGWDGSKPLPPRVAVHTYLGLIEYTATLRERFYRTA